jgi:hypothetical protein
MKKDELSPHVHSPSGCLCVKNLDSVIWHFINPFQLSDPVPMEVITRGDILQLTLRMLG